MPQGILSGTIESDGWDSRKCKNMEAMQPLDERYPEKGSGLLDTPSMTLRASRVELCLVISAVCGYTVLIATATTVTRLSAVSAIMMVTWSSAATSPCGARATRAMTFVELADT
ncbi:uncharacterized protein PHALS_12792 [Plasmopara halstedii]|uniref:Uncharacterized protein n=1 Tax=Plasmopara halstedii TaxID=4781 RepID=A0A0P1AP49_PLAHL|nr:uncharacterized protein PHALS_12792 [Plasmopara halstedii]CEG42525.1 hypothetical protein PHALS_12792 [Plasmopara halstedii]|eukprot:XP_024578894.1 hypothetical protein PHALS_12792 [Plasmopara halstedii]